MNTAFTAQYAQQLDQQDKLSVVRDSFHIPKINGVEQLYLCGNSLC